MLLLLRRHLTVGDGRVVRRVDHVEDRARVQRAARDRQKHNCRVARERLARSCARCGRAGREAQRVEILTRACTRQQQRAGDRAAAQRAGNGAAAIDRDRGVGLRPRPHYGCLRHSECVRGIVGPRQIDRAAVSDKAATECLTGRERPRARGGRVEEGLQKLDARGQRPRRAGRRDDAEELRHGERENRAQIRNVVLRIDEGGGFVAARVRRPDPLQTVAGCRGRAGLRARQTWQRFAVDGGRRCRHRSAGDRRAGRRR
jgi:hypothetical protein